MPEQKTHRSRLSQGWLRGEDFWGDPVSDNFIKTDLLLHPYVLSTTLTDAPLSALGDMHIVAPGATGEWINHDNELAILGDDGWVFFTPYKGVEVRTASPWGKLWWTGEIWQDVTILDPSAPLQGTRYDVNVSVGFEAEPRETLVVFPIPQPMTLPTGAAGSTARCVTPPTSPVVISIRRGATVNTQVGTLTFADNSSFGTYNVPTNALFAKDDLLTFVMPDNPPIGFSNFGMLLRLLLSPT